MVWKFGFNTQKKQSKGVWADLEDNPELKTGDTTFRHGLHPTDMLSLYPSKWADNIYSRKFGETIDEGDDNPGGARSESAASNKRLRTCKSTFFQPEHQDDSKKCDDDNRDDDHDNDDKEPEKTLILGAD